MSHMNRYTNVVLETLIDDTIFLCQRAYNDEKDISGELLKFFSEYSTDINYATDKDYDEEGIIMILGKIINKLIAENRKLEQEWDTVLEENNDEDWK